MEPYIHKRKVDHEVLLRKFIEHLCLMCKSAEKAIVKLELSPDDEPLDDFTFDEELYLFEVIRFFFMSRNQDNTE